MLELLLAFWNHSSIKKNKWEQLERSRYSVYEQEKKINTNVVLTVSPINFLEDKNLKILPLAGLPNRLTINCNENGYWSKFKSDKYGFNNPNSEWLKKKI